jgi:hypothetical protein
LDFRVDFMRYRGNRAIPCFGETAFRGRKTQTVHCNLAVRLLMLCCTQRSVDHLPKCITPRASKRASPFFLSPSLSFYCLMKNPYATRTGWDLCQPILDEPNENENIKIRSYNSEITRSAAQQPHSRFPDPAIADQQPKDRTHHKRVW